MSRDIEAEQLFFVGKFFVIAPRRNRSCSSRCDRRGNAIEQRNLAGGAIAMRCRGKNERFIDAGKKFRALATQKIKRAGLYQTLEHFAIGDSRTKPAAKIFQRSEIPSLFAFPNRHCRSAFANMLDGSEPVADGV